MCVTRLPNFDDRESSPGRPGWGRRDVFARMRLDVREETIIRTIVCVTSGLRRATLESRRHARYQSTCDIANMSAPVTGARNQLDRKWSIIKCLNLDRKTCSKSGFHWSCKILFRNNVSNRISVITNSVLENLEQIIITIPDVVFTISQTTRRCFCNLGSF